MLVMYAVMVTDCNSCRPAQVVPELLCLMLVSCQDLALEVGNITQSEGFSRSCTALVVAGGVVVQDVQACIHVCWHGAAVTTMLADSWCCCCLDGLSELMAVFPASCRHAGFVLAFVQSSLPSRTLWMGPGVNYMQEHALTH